MAGAEKTTEDLAQRVIAGDSLMLVGDEGVGKSHLGNSVAERLTGLGWGRENVFGTPSIRSLRFGAIHHLIATSGTRSADELIAMAEGHLLRLDRGHGSVLIVDDIDGIDVDSLGVVHQLAVRGHRIVATVQSTAAGNELLLPLWKDAVLERVDVVAEPTATASLIDSFLGSPATDSTVERIASLTLGNPLFIRELLADAQSTGSLVASNGVYELTGPLPVANRITDLVNARFADLDPDRRSTLELIAVCEPCDLAALDRVANASALDQLEVDGLIVVFSLDGRATARVDHPLVAEVIRSSTPTLRRRRHESSFGAALLEGDSERSIDLVRSVRWLLDSDTRPHTDHIVAAAHHALSTFDSGTARGLLEAGQLATAERTEIQLILGRASAMEGEVDAALRHLERALDNAQSDDERAEASIAISEAHLFLRADITTARTVGTEALESVNEVGARARIVSSVLLTAGFAGDFQPALTLGIELSDEPELTDESRLAILIMTTLAQAMTGQTKRLEHDLERAERLAVELTSAFPAARDQLLVTRMTRDLADGPLEPASATMLDRLDGLGGEGAMSSVLSQTAATVALARGRGAEARHLALQAVGASAVDPLGVDALAQALAAKTLAAVGDLKASEEQTELCVANPRFGVRERPSLEAAAALRLAKRGDLDAAAEVCIAGSLKSGDNRVWAVDLLHHAVRFGRPETVLAALIRETQFADTMICGSQIEHAKALDARDATRLRAVSQRFAEAGANLYAAEAAAHASRFEKDSGQRSRDAARAHTLFARCDGLWSIAMEQTTDPISAREREVCSAAASGAPTKAIAGQLNLSLRTIENHTQRAFKKLQIHSREELQLIFA